VGRQVERAGLPALLDERQLTVSSAIVLDRLTKFYGTNRGVLELSLDVPRGVVFGFLGPNGAGKSTTIRVLLDLIRPTSGRATVLGLDSRKDSVEIHRRVGYLPGELSLYPRLTARKLFEYFGNLRGARDRARAESLADRFDLPLERPIRSLSRGNKQKVGLVQAFAHRPELLILDEPTSGLDPLMQQVFNSLVRETVAEGGTVFLSSHVLSEVQDIADRAAIIRDGRLVAAEEIDDLRGRAVRELEVRFASAPPRAELVAVPGVLETVVEGNVARLRLEGSPDALVKALARHEVVDLTSHEPDLEDVFLSYYSGDGRAS
jgi:ABC-2 type transport system ATP-binding protein